VGRIINRQTREPCMSAGGYLRNVCFCGIICRIVMYEGEPYCFGSELAFHSIDNGRVQNCTLYVMT
jgi:hypothetical protein